MAKFTYLFVGGIVPEEARTENMNEWKTWFDDLGATGKLRGGEPFGPQSKVVTVTGDVRDYDFQADSNVSGYCTVETDTIEEAIELTAGCPHLLEKYGNGTLEVREVLSM